MRSTSQQASEILHRQEARQDVPGTIDNERSCPSGSADADPFLDPTGGLPCRPDPSVLSESIPLFFIGRNHNGLWVARAADGRAGGLFLRRASALRFAKKNTEPVGFAMMLVADGLELDIENKGNPLAARLGSARRMLLRLSSALTVVAEKVPAPIMEPIRIWLALATVAVAMWILIAVLTAIPRVLSAPLIASPDHAFGAFMPPL
jgi:hypothetical protein